MPFSDAGSKCNAVWLSRPPTQQAYLLPASLCCLIDCPPVFPTTIMTRVKVECGFMLPPPLLLQGPDLGEDGSQDAFHTVMQILAARVTHGCRPPPEAQARLRHAGYACREDAAPAGMGSYWGPK